MIPAYRRYLCLILGLATLGLTGSAAAQDQQKSVLSLYAVRSDSPTATIADPLLARIVAQGLNGHLDYYAEHLDLARFPDPGYEDAVRNFLGSKYRGRRFDLIIANGDSAAAFAAPFRDLFSAGTPIVVNGSAHAQAIPNATGLIAPLSFKDTLDSAIRIQPDTERVVVVSGASTSDQYYEAVARGEFKQLDGRLSFTYLSGLPMRELLAKVAVLPAHSIVFCTGLSRDADGLEFLPGSILDILSAASNVPTYSWLEFGMDHGIVGGTMLSTNLLLTRTAELALRVLRGERPETIPATVIDWSVTEFDWRQLQRWGIDERRLPAGSAILYRQGVWESYGDYIVAGGLLIVVQTGFIAALLLQRARRKRAEEGLDESQKRYTLAIEAAPAGMLMVDSAGRIVLVNAQVEQLFGYRREELLNQPVEMLVPEGLPGRHPGYRSRLQRNPKGLPGGGQDLYGVRKDGVEVPIEIGLNPLRTTAGEFILASIADISERKQAEREHAHLTNHLQRLAGRLIASQEVERTRIARELHDDTSQQLAGLSIALSGLKRRVAALPTEIDLGNDVSSLQQRAATLAENVRRLSHDLHPSVLEHAGLVAALGGYCADIQRQRSVELTFSAEAGDFESTDPETALCLYRVAQEALRNVVSHAGARRAEVRLIRTAHGSELSIVDDGKGFDIVRARTSGAGLGLVSINERVRLVGGSVTIVTELNKGTRVHVGIPVNRDVSAHAGQASERYATSA